MLRLHGFRFSNYHSLVKVVLFERGFEFEEVITYPLADEAYRAKNPTGKFPCLEIEDGTFLGESKVILNYLEDAYPDVPLLPENPLERARVRELMEVIIRADSNHAPTPTLPAPPAMRVFGSETRSPVASPRRAAFPRRFARGGAGEQRAGCSMNG